MVATATAQTQTNRWRCDCALKCHHATQSPLRAVRACRLSDAEASFVATAYDIVSLEKCFGTFNPAVPTTRAETNHTVANFLYTARQLRRLALAANATPPRVLFYWNSGVAVADCYENDLYVLYAPVLPASHCTCAAAVFPAQPRAAIRTSIRISVCASCRLCGAARPTPTWRVSKRRRNPRPPGVVAPDRQRYSCWDCL